MSIFVLSQEDFFEAVIDTRYDLRVFEVTDQKAVQARLESLYGRQGIPSDGEIFISGSKDVVKSRYAVGDLMHIMRRLTGEGGCPWDRAQTHRSIRLNAVEEAYELCDAIDRGDIDNMIEEAGDLLLQAVFHADIAEKSDEFTILDVIDRLVSKLVTRHTHIFGETQAANSEDALKSWEAAKAKEKQATSLEAQLARIPQLFPALLRLEKTVKKLVKHGLENDAVNQTAREAFIALCGALRSGVDLEVEISRLISQLARGVGEGKISKLTQIGD